MLHSYTFNRPVSPHLTIYIPQISSMFSIWHRISGVLLVGGLVFFLLIPKALINLNFWPILTNFFLPNWVFNFLYLSYSFIFAYHGLNGIRHITWDLNLFLETKILKLSTIILSIFLSVILIKIIAIL